MTRMVGITPWTNTLIGQLQGATKPMIETEIMNTVRDFFVASTVWRIDLLLDTRIGEKLYDLDSLVPQADVVSIHRVVYQERLLRPIDDLPFWRDDAGDPSVYWSPEPGQLRIAPIPSKDEDASLRVVVSLRPEPGSGQVPHWVEKKFFSAILSGTLARMYKHAARPYSNPALSADHNQSYRREIVKARATGSRRFTSAPHSFTFPRGWSPIV